jgi:hypothetical protein
LRDVDEIETSSKIRMSVQIDHPAYCTCTPASTTIAKRPASAH